MFANYQDLRLAEVGTRAHVLDYFWGGCLNSKTVPITHWVYTEAGQCIAATFEVGPTLEGRLIAIEDVRMNGLNRWKETEKQRQRRENAPVTREVLIRLPGDADVDLPKLLGLPEYEPWSRSVSPKRDAS